MTGLRRLCLVVLGCLGAWLVAPGAAWAGAGQESTFQDDNQLVFADPAALPGTLDRLRALGVDRLRISVFWATVAPDSDGEARPAFDATDPAAYPAGSWDRYDRIVRLAAERGLAVNFDVTSPAPHWATASLAGRPDLDKDYFPDAAEFGKFVTAAGRRYSGSYATADGPLPRVSYWTVWNEPNQPGWLTPQWVDAGSAGLVEAAPSVYRGLVDAMWGALGDTGHGGDTILVGETAPKGQEQAKGPTRALKPGRFIRRLYCLDDHLQLLKGTPAAARGCPRTPDAKRFVADHPGLFDATGYAHHPYETAFAPDRKPATGDNFTTANLPELTTLLRRVDQRYGRTPKGGVPLYLTEYGYQTDPPDPTGVTLAQQAAYLNQAEYLTWRNPRVRTLTQFLLVDDKPVPGAASPLEAYGGTFQSGLLTLAGKAKPALKAYGLPVFLPEPSVRRGRRLRVWGLVRQAANGSAPSVQVQVRSGTTAFRTVRTVRGSAARGYVWATVPVRRSGTLRLRWRGPGGAVTSRSAAFVVRSSGVSG